MKWMLALVVLGCGGGQSESVSATPVEHAPPPIERTAASPSAPIVYGDIYSIFGSQDDDPPSTLFVALDAEPQPESEPIGTVEVHAGAWTIRVLGEEPVEYATASVIERGSVCEARVTQARRLHATAPTSEHDPSSGGEWTFLGLELEGCRGGSLAVAGAPVRVHSCERDQVETPADPQLVAIVRSSDEDLGWGEPLEPSAYRMLEFSQHAVTVVIGHGAWVVRDGALLGERYHGIPESVVEAGDQLFFQMTSPSEGWAASLEHFSPVSQ